MKAVIEQILFPTDFSENARKALLFVTDLASRAKAKLTLIHVIEEHYEFAPLPDEVKKRIRRKATVLLHGIKGDIAGDSRYGDLEVETVLGGGRPVQSILEELDKNPGLSLIAMGTMGAAGIKKIIFGSNTSDIIIRSKIPVLAVPEDTGHKTSNFVFATDFMKKDLDALKRLRGWAGLYDAAIRVVHVVDNITFANDLLFRGFREVVEERIQHEKLSFDLVVENNFHAGIATYLEQYSDSVLVMNHYPEKTFFPSLQKSESRDLSCYTKVPLLVFNAEEL